MICTCAFQPRCTDALKRLSKNEAISVTGKIFEGQNGATLYLADCDLVGQSSASSGFSLAPPPPYLLIRYYGGQFQNLLPPIPLSLDGVLRIEGKMLHPPLKCRAPHLG